VSAMRREGILALIPHAGAMCLLDRVENWDGSGITCVSARYSAADNPMRRADGSLGTACGIEIAAQAMALHGRLSAPAQGPLRPGFLVSLRDVRLRAASFPPNAGPLTVTARQLLGDARSASYAFTATTGGSEWLSGRATVLFEAPA
jgi:predicted hotdog family 3-hydroxylacyl-ACP dehydratase